MQTRADLRELRDVVEEGTHCHLPACSSRARSRTWGGEEARSDITQSSKPLGKGHSRCRTGTAATNHDRPPCDALPKLCRRRSTRCDQRSVRGPGAAGGCVSALSARTERAGCDGNAHMQAANPMSQQQRDKPWLQSMQSKRHGGRRRS